jgi:outer membrane biosynthesis protein TonB
MSKELYLLVDGTHADPDECDVGADHELRHANGVPVALREDGLPQTVAQGAIENMNVEAAAAVEPDAPPPAAEIKDEPVVEEDKDDLLLTTDDLKPKKEEPKPAKVSKAKAPKPRKATPAKNREIRSR